MLQVFAGVRLPTSQKTLYINNTKMSSSPAFESMLPVREDTPDLLVLEHPPVITHLRRSKRKARTPFIPAPPTTPKRRRPTKKARKLRNSSSPAPAISSPYRQRDYQCVYPLEEGSSRASCGTTKRAYAFAEAIQGSSYSTPFEGFSRRLTVL
jgi:hypothetical protein